MKDRSKSGGGHPDREDPHPRLREAARLFAAGQSAPAAALLREFLKRHPDDAAALHLLAQIARSRGRLDNALTLLARALDCEPGYVPARRDYATALLTARQPEAALLQADELLKCHPNDPEYRAFRARTLEALDDYTGAAAIWRSLTEEHPEHAAVWVRYAYVLRGMGKLDESIAACRRVLAIDPHDGGAWWNLADLKTYRFDDAEIAQMETSLARPQTSAEGRACLHFALGKAYADRGLHERAFGNYARGNAIRRLSLSHDPDVLTTYVARAKRTFVPTLFDRLAVFGCESHEPVFIVGMMRSGSTLVEQILASHPQIEGTRELPEIANISQHLQQQAANTGDEYPRFLEQVDGAALRGLAERYLGAARAHRKLGRPFFLDKMGGNFAHLGLIHLLFPKAGIIDVRRHPLACGFSIFSQYFPEGQNNTFRLADIGHTYRDYVELMAHFDRVLPGRVHRVFYENLVADPEAEIRRLLAYLGLPFETACLSFHRTERTVATVSAEQVRQPIYRSALEQWRNYEPWLGPLKEALGPVLESYPDVPEFSSPVMHAGPGKVPS